MTTISAACAQVTTRPTNARTVDTLPDTREATTEAVSAPLDAAQVAPRRMTSAELVRTVTSIQRTLDSVVNTSRFVTACQVTALCLACIALGLACIGVGMVAGISLVA